MKPCRRGIRAYRVVVTGRQDGRIIGDVFPLHYREQVQRVIRSALPIATVEAAYPNGYIARMDFDEWEQCHGRLYERYGRPERIRYAPENEAELTKQIMLEHRFQKGLETQAPHENAEPAQPVKAGAASDASGVAVRASTAFVTQTPLVGEGPLKPRP